MKCPACAPKIVGRMRVDSNEVDASIADPSRLYCRTCNDTRVVADEHAVSQAGHSMPCPYCARPTIRTNGFVVYGRLDLKSKRIIACFHCDAWVGCHSSTGEPLGAIANKEVRDARRRGHAAFDPLWDKDKARKGMPAGWTPPFHGRPSAYAWLAKELGLVPGTLHFAQMTDLEQIAKAVALCHAKTSEVNRALGAAKRKATTEAKKKELEELKASLPGKAAELARILRGEP